MVLGDPALLCSAPACTHSMHTPVAICQGDVAGVEGRQEWATRLILPVSIATFYSVHCRFEDYPDSAAKKEEAKSD